MHLIGNSMSRVEVLLVCVQTVVIPASEQVSERHISGVAGVGGGSPGGRLESNVGGSTCAITDRSRRVPRPSSFYLIVRLYDNDRSTLSTQSPNHHKVISYRPGFSPNETIQRPFPL